MYRLNVEEFLKRARAWNIRADVVEHIVTTYQDSSFELDNDEVLEFDGRELRNLGGFCIAENELIEVRK